MKVLVLNTGSTSLKVELLESDGERLLFQGIADWSSPPGRFRFGSSEGDRQEEPLPSGSPVEAVSYALRRLTQGAGAPLTNPGDVAAVGHRIVHGGPRFTAPVRITPAVRQELAGLTELAPLHIPVNVMGVDAALAEWPDVPQVASFDTAFHATLSEVARTYPLPSTWTSAWGLRRYGFHGLSNAYCAARVSELLGRPAIGLRLVVCHLGGGCSVTAVRDGVSVDTSMGYTPLDGLMMATRSGSVDPGILLVALRHKGLSADDLERVLNKESGLAGVSGRSADMREVLTGARQGDARCRLARDLFCHRLRQTIGGMVATLGGLDVLVFTAGVGEHSAEVRALTCQGLECLGIELDVAANVACHPDADIASKGRVRVLVLTAREDLTIVRETVRVLAG
jgi:acetate kinase